MTIIPQFIRARKVYFFKNEKSIRFTLSPKGNRIDFSDFSPWGWGIKSEKLVFILNLLK